MTQCKEGAQKEGLMLDTHEELYKWFTSQVIRNLHVVFTMNPSSEGLKDRAATSPALFNRYAHCEMVHSPRVSEVGPQGDVISACELSCLCSCFITT